MKTGFISWQSELPPMSETELGQTFITAYETELWTFPVDTASWNHVASCRFGEGRPCVWSDATLWSGDSYRYDIFTKRDSITGSVQYAMRWWNGSGQGWLICDDDSRRGKSCLLAEIARNTDECRRWDFCHFLWETHHKTMLAAKRTEFHRMESAFLDKRLKRNQRNHKVYVEVLPIVVKVSTNPTEVKS